MTGLSHKKLVITDPVPGAHRLAARLSTHGATPLYYSCLEPVPPEDDAPLCSVLQDIDSFDLMIITGTAVISMVSDYAENTGGNFKGRAVQYAVLDEQTAGDLAGLWGIPAHVIPENYTPEILANVLNLKPGIRILLPQSNLNQTSLSNDLKSLGADVTTVTAYRILTFARDVDLVSHLKNGAVDAIIFSGTSGVVESFVYRFREEGGTLDQLEHVPVVCMNPDSAELAGFWGMRTLVTPEAKTPDGLIQALMGYW